jgi:hypothetical protein
MVSPKDVNRLLDGPTSTQVLVVDESVRETPLPRSWLVAAHRTARRLRPMDDHRERIDYHEYTDEEILASLSVKLDFNLDEVQEGSQEDAIEVLYYGLKELDED